MGEMVRLWSGKEMTCALAGIFGLMTLVCLMLGLGNRLFCIAALIPFILGALCAMAYERGRRRKEEDARTRAIIEAYQRGHYPPPR